MQHLEKCSCLLLVRRAGVRFKEAVSPHQRQVSPQGASISGKK
jgi:hypothetical protein